MNRLFAIAVLYLTAACTPLAFPEFTPELNERVTVKSSEFDRVVTFFGIQQYAPNNEECFTCGTLVSIVSWTDKIGENPTHKIAVNEAHVGDWRFWISASDRSTKQHELNDISRKVVNCAGRDCVLSETFSISLSDEYLRAHQSGFALQARSQSGHTKIITVPPGHIQAQLAAIETYRNQRQ